jgi:GxxExxY protein
MSYVIEKKQSDQILKICFTVHNELGPGLLESVYKSALAVELRRRGILYVKEQSFPVYFRQERIGLDRAGFVINNSIVLEVKYVDALAPVMTSQLINYLRLSGIRVGYLVNFRNERISWIRRVVSSMPGIEASHRCHRCPSLDCQVWAAASPRMRGA